MNCRCRDPVWQLLVLACALALGCGGKVQAPSAAAEPTGAGKRAAQDVLTAQKAGEKSETSEPEGVRVAQQPLPPRGAGEAKHPFPRRVKAPPLTGGVEWLNTAGPLELRDLRGKFVLLDFWTYCCINCMHILPELKKLERAYPNEIVVIGVHSAKFDTEKDSQNIREAILRYEIEHPVVNDANHVIWQRYQVTSWPSLRVIDPEGYLIAGDSGEVTFEVLDQFFKKAIPYYKRKGVLDLRPLHFRLEREKLKPTPLRFPGKVLADEKSRRLFIADSNHNRIVVATLEGKLLEVIGTGEQGARNGSYDQATFNHPQGMVLHGDVLYVADTENHLIRKVDLKSRHVSTVAGTGRQAMNPWPGLRFDRTGRPVLPRRYVGKPRSTPLNSPWALWVHKGYLYIAMAGPHQIWRMDLEHREIGPWAGNGREDIVDGPLLPRQPYALGFCSFAQPSGLTSDGQWLYVADSEGSSIRAVPFTADKEVWTVLGTSKLPYARLFTFGDVDGPVDKARLQHPLGVAYRQGKLYIADTYNCKIKELDLQKKVIRTIAGTGEHGRSDSPAQFDEPGGVSIALGKLYVADTNNHLIRVIDLENGYRTSTLTIQGLEPPKPPRPKPQPLRPLPGAKIYRPSAATVSPKDGVIQLEVVLKLPAGWKLNADAPLRYRLVWNPASGSKKTPETASWQHVNPPQARFTVPLKLPPEDSSRLELWVTYYYCQAKETGLCKVGQAIWHLRFNKADQGRSTLRLEHVVEP